MRNLSVKLFIMLNIFAYTNSSSLLISQNDLNTDVFNMNYINAVKYHSSYFDTLTNKKGSGWKPFMRVKYFMENRLNPDGSYPDLRKTYLEFQNFKKSKNNSNQANFIWKALGPFNTVNSSEMAGAGRINVIKYNPSNENVLWAGSSGGGLWKSTNAGQSWNVFDQTVFMSIGISDIAISPTNTNTLYVATGDADGPSGMGQYPSLGIMKTTNGGSSWELLSPVGSALNRSNLFEIYKVIVHPSNLNIVYTATSSGVYKTTDGGKTWLQISSQVCRDLAINTNNAALLYGAFFTSGSSMNIQKYDATLSTWSIKATYSDCGRMKFATTTLDDNLIYAALADANGSFRAFAKSIDAGETWTTPNVKSNQKPNYFGSSMTSYSSYGQGKYDLAIAVSNSNKNTVYIGGISAWKTTDGGTTFKGFIDAYNRENTGLPSTHPDMHDLLVTPTGKMFLGCDGGVYASTNNGSSWFDSNNGLQIMEFARIATAQTDDTFIMGGAQDNGTSQFSQSNWNSTSGGDGMDCAIDNSNGQYLYASAQNGSFYKSVNAGKSIDQFPMIHGINQQIGNQLPNYTNEAAYWCAPIIIDPKTPQTIYVGFQNVWKSTDRGTTFKKISTFGNNQNQTLMAIAVAPSNSNYIYASYAANYSGPNSYDAPILWRTTDGGTNWTKMSINTQISSIIVSIAVDPKNPLRIFVASSGFVNGKKVFEINNTTITNVSNVLPNVPVNSIIYQNNSSDRLYIGTDLGVFFRDLSNPDWTLYGEGLPTVIVNDLDINYSSMKLKAGTYGRGIWEVPLLDCNIAAPIVSVVGGVKDNNNIYQMCTGDSLVISITNDLSGKIIAWSNGSNGKSIVVKTNGIYNAKITDGTGCSANTTNYEVYFNTITIPTINYDATKLNLCGNDSLDLTVKGIGLYSKYLWNTGETTKKINVKKTGDYYCIATAVNAPCDIKSEVIKVKSSQIPQVPTIVNEGSSLVSSLDATSYQWYLSDIKIANAISKKFTPIKDGIYKVEVFNENGCSSFSLDFSYSLSIENDVDNKLVSINPNPNNGIFEINIYSIEIPNIEITLLNIDGKEIFNLSENVFSNSYKKKLSFEYLAKGLYYLRIKLNNQIIVKKVIRD